MSTSWTCCGQRSVEARREKARRGELLQSAPVGYIKTEDQRLFHHGVYVKSGVERVLRHIDANGLHILW